MFHTCKGKNICSHNVRQSLILHSGIFRKLKLTIVWIFHVTCPPLCWWKVRWRFWVYKACVELHSKTVQQHFEEQVRKLWIRCVFSLSCQVLRTLGPKIWDDSVNHWPDLFHHMAQVCWWVSELRGRWLVISCVWVLQIFRASCLPSCPALCYAGF